ncbi:MAG: LacI family transcriptional regulator, partial [Anaerolineae bacterium]|nr:LacI family transcriptional regulator [Anaerolineae bacterium]
MPDKPRNPSLNLEDIARLSGVSRSTVSRVVNNSPNVREDTRERVLEVIRKHKFTPNLAARALVTQRTQVIGMYVPYFVSDLFSDPYFPVLIQALT